MGSCNRDSYGSSIRNMLYSPLFSILLAAVLCTVDVRGQTLAPVVSLPAGAPMAAFMMAPGAAPPAAAVPTLEPDIGPTADAGPAKAPCPCLETTTPPPESLTAEPGSPEDAKEDIEKRGHEAGDEIIKGVTDHIGDGGNHEIDSIKKTATASGVKAEQTLKGVFGKEFNGVTKNLDSDEAHREDVINDMRAQNSDTAKEHAEEITEASSALAHRKAEVVIGNVRQGAKEEIAKVFKRIEKVAADTVDLVKFSENTAGRAENAALRAAHFAEKVPKDMAIKAQSEALQAEEKALTVQDLAHQSQKLAEQTATLAWEAKEMSDKAVVDSKTAVRASQAAYDAAMENKKRLVKLKAKADQITKNVKTMHSEATSAERMAVTVQDEAKQVDPLLTR